jgi:amidase
MKPEAIWEVETGRSATAETVQRASGLRSDWFRAVAALFQRYDALVLPSAQVWPFPKDWRWPETVAGRAMDSYHRWMEVVIPVSLLGLPAINLPAGFGAQGLPMGMQMFGPRDADHALLRMAEAYHRATDWPGRNPPPH